MSEGLWRRDPDAIVAEVDGKAMLLSVRSWTYASFNEVGERIWELLAEPSDTGGLVRSLLGRFEGDEAEIRADVADFLAQLHRDGFLVRD